VPQSFTIAQANQTITFAALPNKTFGDGDFSISATASSGLTVSFTASGQCTVTGTNVHLTSAGSCLITASQSGDANYNPATSVAQSFTSVPMLFATPTYYAEFADTGGINKGDKVVIAGVEVGLVRSMEIYSGGDCRRGIPPGGRRHGCREETIFSKLGSAGIVG